MSFHAIQPTDLILLALIYRNNINDISASFLETLTTSNIASKFAILELHKSLFYISLSKDIYHKFIKSYCSTSKPSLEEEFINLETTCSKNTNTTASTCYSIAIDTLQSLNNENLNEQLISEYTPISNLENEMLNLTKNIPYLTKILFQKREQTEEDISYIIFESLKCLIELYLSHFKLLPNYNPTNSSYAFQINSIYSTALYKTIMRAMRNKPLTFLISKGFCCEKNITTINITNLLTEHLFTLENIKALIKDFQSILVICAKTSLFKASTNENLSQEEISLFKIILEDLSMDANNIIKGGNYQLINIFQSNETIEYYKTLSINGCINSLEDQYTLLYISITILHNINKISLDKIWNNCTKELNLKQKLNSIISALKSISLENPELLISKEEITLFLKGLLFAFYLKGSSMKLFNINKNIHEIQSLFTSTQTTINILFDKHSSENVRILTRILLESKIDPTLHKLIPFFFNYHIENYKPKIHLFLTILTSSYNLHSQLLDFETLFNVFIDEKILVKNDATNNSSNISLNIICYRHSLNNIIKIFLNSIYPYCVIKNLYNEQSSFIFKNISQFKFSEASSLSYIETNRHFISILNKSFIYAIEQTFPELLDTKYENSKHCFSEISSTICTHNKNIKFIKCLKTCCKNNIPIYFQSINSNYYNHESLLYKQFLQNHKKLIFKYPTALSELEDLFISFFYSYNKINKPKVIEPNDLKYPLLIYADCYLFKFSDISLTIQLLNITELKIFIDSFYLSFQDLFITLKEEFLVSLRKNNFNIKTIKHIQPIIICIIFTSILIDNIINSSNINKSQQSSFIKLYYTFGNSEKYSLLSFLRFAKHIKDSSYSSQPFIMFYNCYYNTPDYTQSEYDTTIKECIELIFYNLSQNSTTTIIQIAEHLNSELQSKIPFILKTYKKHPYRSYSEYSSSFESDIESDSHLSQDEQVLECNKQSEAAAFSLPSDNDSKNTSEDKLSVNQPSSLDEKILTLAEKQLELSLSTCEDSHKLFNGPINEDLKSFLLKMNYEAILTGSQLTKELSKPIQTSNDPIKNHSNTKFIPWQSNKQQTHKKTNKLNLSIKQDNNSLKTILISESCQKWLKEQPEELQKRIHKQLDLIKTLGIFNNSKTLKDCCIPLNELKLYHPPVRLFYTQIKNSVYIIMGCDKQAQNTTLDNLKKHVLPTMKVFFKQDK